MSPRAGSFLVSEGNGSISREVVTVASGAGALVPGTVLGQVTATGKFVAYVNTATDGSEVARAVLYGPVDATAADAKAVAVVRLAEVNAAELVWAAGNDAAAITAGRADLASVNVIAR